jgi:hypothetical protein
MADPIRVTGPLVDVLARLLDAFNEGRQLHGWAIVKATKRSGPTVYGVLDRLEDLGWVVGRWEQRPAEPNKPRRRFYELTPTGYTGAVGLLRERRRIAPTRTLRPAPGALPGMGSVCSLPGGTA